MRFEAAGRVRSYREFETLNADNYSCPVCGATDRERLMTLFMSEPGRLRPIAESSGAPMRLLHLAPEPALSAWLRRQQCLERTTADRDRTDVDVRTDITALAEFDDQRFDAVICAHVLEHVPEDRRAMAALLRVLRPGGWALLLVPILRDLEADWEDPTVSDPHERLRLFGQTDHVRVFSRPGWLGKLSQAGFAVDALEMAHFGAEAFKRSAIEHGSTLYVARRP